MNAQQHQPQTASQAQSTVQGSLQNAMLRANEVAAKPSNTVHNISNVNSLKAIVCRRDILGNALVFDVDSHVKREDGEFIDYWDGKGTGMKTAPIQYYKVSKPMSSQDSAKLSESFAKAMKLSQVHVRMRLVKEGSGINRDAQGNVNSESIEDFKARFKLAVDKMLEAL